jgi:hypothetical protein
MRLAVMVLAAVVGLLLGGAGMLAVERPAPASTTSTTTSTTLPAVTPAPIPRPEGRVLLAWTSGGLPDGFADRVAGLAEVEAVTLVKGDLVDLADSWDAGGAAVDRPPEGLLIPLEAASIDPKTYSEFLPADARPLVAALGEGEAILGSTSARLRRLDVGGRLELAGGASLAVVGVLDDALVGAAELVVSTPTGDELGITTPRYVLVTHRGDRSGTEGAIEELASSTPVRVRGPGETPFFRHGDAVLPQAHIKDRFGEFAYRLGDGTSFSQDPAWTERFIVTTQIPLLGRATGHRAFLPALEGAMAELVERGLEHLVDPQGFAGCWNPRLIGPGAGISRHAWGAAVDINFGANPTGLQSSQDPRLVEVMERWGFTWGGSWLVPDPAHFEYLRPPAPPPPAP